MAHTPQAIPLDAITVGEAFELLFHVKFPDWRARMTRPDCFKSAADFAQHERDEREVTDLLYDSYRDGIIAFYERDATGEVLRLTGGEENSWIKHAFANGLLPSNLHAGGSHPPIFLMKADVERLAKPFRTGYSRGRPPIHDWPMIKQIAKKLWVENGDPGIDENKKPGWRSQADFTDAIGGALSEQGVEEPAYSLLKDFVSKFVKEQRVGRK